MNKIMKNFVLIFAFSIILAGSTFADSINVSIVPQMIDTPVTASQPSVNSPTSVIEEKITPVVEVTPVEEIVPIVPVEELVPIIDVTPVEEKIQVIEIPIESVVPIEPIEGKIVPIEPIEGKIIVSLHEEFKLKKEQKAQLREHPYIELEYNGLGSWAIPDKSEGSVVNTIPSKTEAKVILTNKKHGISFLGNMAVGDVLSIGPDFVASLILTELSFDGSYAKFIFVEWYDIAVPYPPIIEVPLEPIQIEIPEPVAEIKPFEEKTIEKVDILKSEVVEGEKITLETPKITKGKKKEDCKGCFEDSTCLSIGIRAKDESSTSIYCDIDKTIKYQKDDNEECQNNFECKSNTCGSGKCINLQKELEESRSLLEKILELLIKVVS